MGLFCDFKLAILLNICSYFIDVIAIIALIKCNKRLLSVYWISMTIFSIYSLISVTNNSFNLNDFFTILYKIMMFILVISSTLKLRQTIKDVFNKIYYIPIAIFSVVKLDTIIQYKSGLSTIINYCLSGVAYFCMVYWCIKISGELYQE